MGRNKNELGKGTISEGACATREGVMATISNAIGNSNDVVSHESLQYIAAIIKAARRPPK
jgi:hypothetical protein